MTIALAERAAGLGYDHSIGNSAWGKPEPIKVDDSWQIIGRGKDRTAYLAPDGYVYKVEDSRDDPIWGASSVGTNFQEYRNYLRLSAMELPDGFAIPKMEIFETSDGATVLKCQYIPGNFPEGESMADAIDDVCLSLAIYDSNLFNCIVSDEDGLIYIIDLAS